MSSLIQKQLDTLKGLGLSGGEASPREAPASCAYQARLRATAAEASPSEAEQRPSRFQAYRAGARGADSGLSPAQKRHIDALTARLTAKTAGSKQRTAAARPDARRSARRRGLPPGMEGARLPPDLRPVERLAHLGH